MLRSPLGRRYCLGTSGGAADRVALTDVAFDELVPRQWQPAQSQPATFSASQVAGA